MITMHSDGKVDTALAKLTYKILKVLCRASGKDNFFFAYLAMYISLVCILGSYVIQILNGHGVQYFWYFLLAIYVWFFWDKLRLLAHLKEIGSRLSGATIDTFNVSLIDMIYIRRAIYTRLIWFCLTIASIVIEVAFILGGSTTKVYFADTLFICGAAMLSISFYCATLLHPPGKSVVERAREWIQDHARVPQLAPIPIGA